MCTPTTHTALTFSAAVLSLLLALSCDAVAGEKAGLVQDAQGGVSARTAGTDRPLAAGGEVFIGDTVKTGREARAQLALGQRTTVRMGGQTEIRIDRYLADAGGEIELGGGALMFDRSGEPSADSLTFRSAYGLIAVRGTVFYAGPSKGKFGVFVERGRVEVTGGGKTVSVGSQEGTDIAEPGAQPSEPRRWKHRRIKPLKLLVK